MNGQINFKENTMKMAKIISLFALVCALTLSACAKKEPVPTPEIKVKPMSMIGDIVGKIMLLHYERGGSAYQVFWDTDGGEYIITSNGGRQEYTDESSLNWELARMLSTPSLGVRYRSQDGIEDLLIRPGQFIDNEPFRGNRRLIGHFLVVWGDKFKLVIAYKNESDAARGWAALEAVGQIKN